LYVILPLFAWIGWSSKWLRSPPKITKFKPQKKWVIHSCFISAVIVLGYFNWTYQNQIHKDIRTTDSLVELQGFESIKVKFDGTKLINDNALIYVKPCRTFWGAEHNPIICWSGSGYTFNAEQEIVINGFPVYIAELHNKLDKLYTAWWFSNGEVITTSQIEWRWNMIEGGKAFNMINVTCSSPEELEDQVRKLLIVDVF